jgi:hypothetical protein
MSEHKMSAEVDSQSSNDDASGLSTRLQVVVGDASDAMDRFDISTDRICKTNNGLQEAVYAGRNFDSEGMNEVEIREHGWLGNPFVEEDGRSKKECARLFEQYLDRRLKQDPQLAGALSALAGERFECFCQHVHDDDTWCHGIVLARYADYLERVRDVKRGKQ